VMPRGSTAEQSLICVTRLSTTRYSEQTLAPVRFVLLVGAGGWEADETRTTYRED